MKALLLAFPNIGLDPAKLSRTSMCDEIQENKEETRRERERG